MRPAGTAIQASVVAIAEAPNLLGFEAQIGHGSVTTMGTQVVPAGTAIEGSGWVLASDLSLILTVEGAHFVARAHAVDEYGMGATAEEAVRDLLTSLAEYLESLMRRERLLTEPLSRDLRVLKALVERQ